LLRDDAVTRSRQASRAAVPIRSARFLVTLLVLLTFSLQTYIAQTHIHLKPGTFAGQMAGKKPAPDKFPTDSDPANCPICQELMHTGAFVTPSAAALLAPTASVSIIAIVTVLPAVTGLSSHAWRSRAPPVH
jgi:hypothetical protein